jgi:CRP-like cAMP-binding protein
MSGPQQSTVRNKLLALLPAADYDRLAPHLTHLELRRGTILAEHGAPIDYLYFFQSGIGSVVATTPEGNRSEAGLFGFDGYVPTSAVADIDLSPHHVNVQIDADAYRIDYDIFRDCMRDSANVRRVMLRAMEAFAVQLAYTAVSNAIHDVNERLARWLLMCHDRLPGNDVPLTHEYLAIMLAVRRPSVTTSLHVLEGNGFIRSERGNIVIRNRKALEEFAHDAYGKPEKEYRRLMADLS